MKGGKTMKRILSMCLVIFMFSLSTFTTQALDEDVYISEEIIEEYSYTSSVNSTISISGRSATCKSTILGNSYVTKIIITQTLQRKSGTSWSNITSWSKTYSANYAIFTNSRNSLSSGTYRTHTVAKVYKGANYETVSANSSTKSISL